MQKRPVTSRRERERVSRCSFASDRRWALLVLTSVAIATSCWHQPVQAAATIEGPPPAEQQQQPQDNMQMELVNQVDSDGQPPVVKTQVPVIGILTEVLRDYKRFVHDRHLFIASSYVKWIESAGAQVVPILLNQDELYYEQMFNQTNGLLFPGGDNLLDPSKRTPMMVAAKKLYQLAIEANDRGDYYPIWGTCLGLELLSVLAANRNLLVACEANDISLPMEFTADRGKLFSQNTCYANLPALTTDFSQIIRDTLKQENLTYNFHHKCLTDESLQEAGLADFYKPLAYSRDKNSLRFIAILEANQYPFYAVQFHPEKPPFEFVVKKSQLHVPHSRQSIAVSRFFADFFVQQAQLSGHPTGPKQLPLEVSLIYAFDPMYTAPKKDMYEQRYLFPYSNTQSLVNGLSNEEFIEHVPDPDEEVPEEVSEAGKFGNLQNGYSHQENDLNDDTDQSAQYVAINQVVAFDLEDEDDANDAEEENEDDDYENDNETDQVYFVN